MEAKKLLANTRRPKSIKVNAVIGNEEATVTWIDLSGDLEVISAVKELSSPAHLLRIENELKRLPREKRTDIVRKRRGGEKKHVSLMINPFSCFAMMHFSAG